MTMEGRKAAKRPAEEPAPEAKKAAAPSRPGPKDEGATCGTKAF